MKHFIITRFNYAPDYKYLPERIKLFEQYTLPSLQKQTNKNFMLVVLGKPDIRIEGIQHIFLEWKENEGGHYVKPLVDFLKDCSTKDGIILTSRVDNDDMYLPNYVETVQKIAETENVRLPYLIEQKGYWYDKRVEKYYTNERYRANLTSPFLSMVEKGTYNTVFLANHSKMGKRFPVIFSENYGWIQIIHKTNQLMNKIPVGQLEGKEVKSEIINETIIIPKTKEAKGRGDHKEQQIP